MADTITLFIIVIAILGMFRAFSIFTNISIPVFDYIRSRVDDNTDDYKEPNKDKEAKEIENKPINIVVQHDYHTCQYCRQPAEKGVICGQCGANTGI